MEIIAKILSEGLNVSFTFANPETLEINVFRKWEDGVELKTTKRIGNLEMDLAAVPTSILRLQLQEAFDEFKNGAVMIDKGKATENDE